MRFVLFQKKLTLSRKRRLNFQRFFHLTAHETRETHEKEEKIYKPGGKAPGVRLTVRAAPA